MKSCPNELRQCLDELGLNRAEPVELIRDKQDVRLYRLRSGPHSYVLKWFSHPDGAKEAHGYALLRQCGVPTLPVHGQTTNALLLEDAKSSKVWRLATRKDMTRRKVGEAVAEWYRRFHAAGRKFLAQTPFPPAFLGCEFDLLTPEVVLRIGLRLMQERHAVWRLAAERIEILKEAMHALAQTFNYCDFYYGNLALSRQSEGPLRAVVFDYHMLGAGLAYSDCRNVVGSLGPAAATAFWEVYGETDHRETVLDAPLSVLHALAVAADLPTLPRWAASCIDKVRSGVFEKDLRKALEMLED